MDYQLAVIGGGPGGYSAAIQAAHEGLRVALIEKEQLGGTCLNRGCIPTKALIHSADLYSQAKKFGELGIELSNLDFDMEKIFANKNEIVTKLRDGVEQLIRANKIALFKGTGFIAEKNKITIKNDTAEEISAEHIIIATGSTAVKPPIEGINLDNVFVSDTLLATPKKFNRLVVIGGGVIGLEFAGIYHSLDCETTMIEAAERIISVMDREISQNISMIYKKRGVAIHTSSFVTKIEKDEQGLVCHFTEKGQAKEIACDAVLVSVGRRSAGENVCHESLGITLAKGAIPVDENFTTTVQNIYAVGDVIGGIQLAHLAAAQGVYAVEKIVGKNPTANVHLVPSCIYTSPEISSVGMTADEAKAAGIPVRVGKFSMLQNGRSLIEKIERGVIKVVANAETDQVLGVQMICGRATDLIAEASLSIANHLTVGDMLKAIRPHPTFAEGMTEALENVNGRSIHTASGLSSPADKK